MLRREVRVVRGELLDRARHGVGHTPLTETGPDFDFALRAGWHAAQQNGGAPAEPGDLRQAGAGRASAQHLQHIAPAELLVVSFRHVYLLIID